MTKLKIISYNVKGLNTPEKRTIILSELWRLKAQVAFIQETHFRQDRIPRLYNFRYPICYNSCSKGSKSKGVSIVLSKNIGWEEIAIKRDEEGRWLLVKGRCLGKLFTFATLYAPNRGQAAFLEEFLDNLMDFSDGALVVGGDWNLPLDPLMDTSQGKSSVPFATLRKIRRELLSWKLVDGWRILHPTEKDFTFYSVPHRSYSRIDYLLTRHMDFSLITAASIESITSSDHAPVSVSLDWGSREIRQSNWRLNLGLLQDKEVERSIREEIKFFFETNATPGISPIVLWETHKAFVRGLYIKHGARIKRKGSSTSYKKSENRNFSTNP